MSGELRLKDLNQLGALRSFDIESYAPAEKRRRKFSLGI